MGPQAQHGGREHDHVVQADALHGAPGQHHVGVVAAPVVDAFESGRVVGDAAAHVLVGQAPVADEPVGLGLLVRQGLGANDRVFDVLADLLPVNRLHVVGVHIEEHVVLISPFLGLPPSVGQDVAGIGVCIDSLDRDLFHSFNLLGHASSPLRRANKKGPAPPPVGATGGAHRSLPFN